jgi:hypothetical protein
LAPHQEPRHDPSEPRPPQPPPRLGAAEATFSWTDAADEPAWLGDRALRVEVAKRVSDPQQGAARWLSDPFDVSDLAGGGAVRVSVVYRGTVTSRLRASFVVTLLGAPAPQTVGLVNGSAEIAEIDLRDGQADGRIGTSVSDCPSCGRKVNARRGSCLFCGEPIRKEYVFDPG